jgi:hypothetical protein
MRDCRSISDCARASATQASAGQILQTQSKLSAEALETIKVRFKSILKVLGLAGLGFIAACGDGGGGGGSESRDAPSGVARLECQVTDSVTGKRVADADVTYQARTATYSTTTNADGNCRLDMPGDEVTGVRFPAATATKSGYEPQTIICESLSAGSSCYQEVRMIPLASRVSIPVGGDTVMHLGDDVFEGVANSLLQKPTDGTEVVLPIADWADQVKSAGITKATVYLDAKGWQSDVCDNRIALRGDVGQASLRGGVSPSGGFWGGGRQVPFEFNVDEIGRLSAELRINSGSCAGTTDIDDFEINRIRVEFN